MARKFSLKDNPIFQRLQVPGKKPDDSQPSIRGSIEDPADLRRHEEIGKGEGQFLRVEHEPSRIDPQELTLKKEGGPSLGPEGQDRQVVRSSDSTSHGHIEEKQSEKVQGATPFASSGDPAQIVQSPSGRFVEDIQEGQNLTLKNRTSNFDPQIESQDEVVRKVTDIPSHDLKGELARDGVTSEQHSADTEEGQNLTLKNSLSEATRKSSGVKRESEASFEIANASDLGLQDSFDKSLFFSFYNEVCDDLLPTLEGAEQILYARLFRLSYGFNRNYCCVSQPVLGEKTGLSRNTVRTALQSLIEKEWVYVIEAGRHVSTKYRVYLPRERNRGSKLDPQKKRVKIRPSNIDHQNLSVNFRGSNIDNPEGQKTEVQNLTVKKPLWKLSSGNSSLLDSPPKFDPQKMPPLLLTHNSSTLSRRETDSQSSSTNDLSHKALILVEKFYSLLGQQPSTAKSQKSIAECVALLRDGFRSDQIDYAVSWLITHHPATGSFTRVAHFIDQALKEKDREQLVSELESRKTAELESQRLEEQRLEEERRQIDEVIGSLSPEALDLLNSDARRLVESENGQVRFGKQTLVQIKIRELIRARYLASERR